MKDSSLLDKIDLQLIRTLHTLLTERSVSKAALRLGQHQPAVSLALKRLRDLMDDPILVRSGTGMVPTEFGLSLIEPSAHVLSTTQSMFSKGRTFDPAKATHTFRIAAGDTLDPLFLPLLIGRIKSLAPLCRVEVHTPSPQAQYAHELAHGLIDVVIGNWTNPSEELHRAPLFDDEVVSLVSDRHPAVRRGWSVQDWLNCEHVAPTPAYPGWRGVIDQHLDTLNMQRNIAVRCTYFGLMPGMVASSLLVLTTGRHYCQRYLNGNGGPLALQILTPPLEFPKMTYCQLWHERSHVSPSARWLRTQIKSCADELPLRKTLEMH